MIKSIFLSLLFSFGLLAQTVNSSYVNYDYIKKGIIAPPSGFIYYVNGSTGSNTNDGLTALTPFKTIEHADSLTSSINDYIYVTADLNDTIDIPSKINLYNPATIISYGNFHFIGSDTLTSTRYHASGSSTTIDTTTLRTDSIQVPSSGFDLRSYAGTQFSSTGAYFILGKTSSYPDTVVFGFQNQKAKHGAIIVTAELHYRSYSATTSDIVNLSYRAIKVANLSSITSAANLKSQLRTSAKAYSAALPHWNGSYEFRKSVSLVSPFQEWVSSVGDSGNNVWWVVTDSSSTSSAGRYVNSYDNSSTNATYFYYQWKNIDTVGGTGTGYYYYTNITSMPGLFINGTRATNTSTLDSLTVNNYHYSGDTLYFSDQIQSSKVRMINPGSGFNLASDNISFRIKNLIQCDTALIVRNHNNININGLGNDALVNQSNYGLYAENSNNLTIDGIVFDNNRYWNWKTNDCNIVSIQNCRGSVVKDYDLWSYHDTTYYLYNNLFYRDNTSGLRNDNYFDGTKGITIKNNYSHEGSSYAYHFVNSSTITAMDYNAYLWYFGHHAMININGTDIDSLNDLVSAGYGGNSIVIPVDSMAVNNWSGGDFSYPSYSFLINAGTNILDHDANNNPRPIGSFSDIGNIEYNDNGLPSAPTNVTVASITDSTINVNWDKVAYADSYYVYYRPYDTTSFVKRTVVSINNTTLKIGKYSSIPDPSFIQFGISNVNNNSAQANATISNVGNGTFRIRYGLVSAGVYTDSITQGTHNVYPAKKSYFYVKAKNNVYGLSDSIGTTSYTPPSQTYNDSLTGLSSSSDYIAQGTLTNANGYFTSSSSSFTTGSSSNFSTAHWFIASAAKGGNSSNSGHSPLAPKDFTFAQTHSFTGGDTLSGLDGDKITGQLIITSSGSVSNPFVMNSYPGTGKKFILTLRQSIPNWNNDSYWTAVSSDTIWSITFPTAGTTSRAWYRMWFDNVEYLWAFGLYSDNGDGTSGVNRTHRFLYNNSTATLYVYCPHDNPGAYYSNIEYPGEVESDGTTLQCVLGFKNVSYITLKNWDVEGGMYEAIGIGGSNHITIDHCVAGKYSNWAGVYGNSAHVGSIGSTCSYNTISNDSVISMKTLHQLKDNGVLNGPEYGIVYGDLNGSGYTVEHWTISNNVIKDFTFDIYGHNKGATSGSIKWADIHNNDLSNPDLAYGKCMQIENRNNSDTAMAHSKFYLNYCHDSPLGINVLSGGNKFYFNAFKNITVSLNGHASQSNSGYGFEILTDYSLSGITAIDSNYFFNNTFTDLNSYGILNFLSSGSHQFFYNNLFVNNHTANPSLLIQTTSGGNDTWKNNEFYSPSATTSTQIINIASLSSYTLSGFEALNGTHNKTIANNQQYVGSQNNLIYDNYSNHKFSLIVGGLTDVGTVPSWFFTIVGANFYDAANNQVTNGSATVGTAQAGWNWVPEL